MEGRDPDLLAGCEEQSHVVVGVGVRDELHPDDHRVEDEEEATQGRRLRSELTVRFERGSHEGSDRMYACIRCRLQRLATRY